MKPMNTDAEVPDRRPALIIRAAVPATPPARHLASIQGRLVQLCLQLLLALVFCSLHLALVLRLHQRNMMDI